MSAVARLHLAEGEQVRAVADQLGAAVGDLEDLDRLLVEEAAMEELGGEAQPLATPQRMAGIEPDRAVVLILQVLQRVGQRGIGRLVRLLRQVARQVAHGRAIERRRLLGPRGTRPARQRSAAPRPATGCHADASRLPWIEDVGRYIARLGRDDAGSPGVEGGYSSFSTRKPPTMPAASMLVTRVSRRSMKSRTGVPNARSNAATRKNRRAARDDAGGHEHQEVEPRPRRRRW